MKNELSFDFQVDENTNTIKVVRTFNATLLLVWKAWTTEEILDQWWAPEGYKSFTKTMEFREGGMRHYRIQGPENFEMWGITSYSKIQLHSKFSGKEYSADEEAEITQVLPPSDYHVSFLGNGEKCTIEHNTTYDNGEHMKQSLEYGFKEGMLGAFERLDTYLGKKTNEEIQREV